MSTEIALQSVSWQRMAKGNDFELIPLANLVRMKLISFRDKDRMHLRDLIAVGLVDASWPGRFPVELGQRLQMILDDTEG